jgi:tetraacyldisaccharide 4'-kinase
MSHHTATDLRPVLLPSLRSILSGEDRRNSAKFVRFCLNALEPPYRAAVALRNRGFDRGWRTVHDLGRPTVSVGNLTLGGTGKTPMVVAICRKLLALGLRPGVLLRGYKSHGGRSDEADELQTTLGGQVTVMADPDRVASARLALQHDPGIAVFVLDDGFQHRRARRDLDLVLLDAARPFADGHVLPRGILREPRENLRRADAVILTHADLASPDQLTAARGQVQQLTGRLPVAVTAHAWVGLRDHLDREHPLDVLRDKRVIGVSGIGDPASFEHSLAHHVAAVARMVRFADHHRYTHDSLRELFDPALAARGDAFVTTEKDWVKWAPLFGGASMPVPVYRAVLALQFLDGEAAVDTLLQTALAGTLRVSGAADA